MKIEAPKKMWRGHEDQIISGSLTKFDSRSPSQPRADTRMKLSAVAIAVP